MIMRDEEYQEKVRAEDMRVFLKGPAWRYLQEFLTERIDCVTNELLICEDSVTMHRLQGQIQAYGVMTVAPDSLYESLLLDEKAPDDDDNEKDGGRRRNPFGVRLKDIAEKLKGIVRSPDGSKLQKVEEK